MSECNKKPALKQTSNEVIHHLDEDTVCLMEENEAVGGNLVFVTHFNHRKRIIISHFSAANSAVISI